MKVFKNIKKFVSTFIAEILVIIGAIFVSVATLLVNVLIGLYVIGVIFFLLGLVSAKKK